jgi:iron complex transport system substrate-binding protein
MLVSVFTIPVATAADDAVRIVSVGGALTEIVYALGAEDKLAGVDTTSRWPAAASKLPQVGYQRNLSAEGVLSLRPSLVLATTDAGPPEAIAQIRRAGVPVEIFSAEPEIAAIYEKVRGVAAAVNRRAVGEQLVNDLAQAVRRTESSLAAITSRPRVMFLLNVGTGAPLASGTGTSANAMIRLAHADNVLTSFAEYKPVSAETLVAAQPEVLLMTDDTLKQLGGLDGLLKVPGVKMTPAGRDRRVVTMDGLYLLGFGPRQPQAILDLARRLHPKLQVSGQ